MPNAETYKYDDLSENLRWQIIYIWQDVIDESRAAFLNGDSAFYSAVERALLSEFGEGRFSGSESR